MKNKKSQGMSVNVIIIAAVALIVLVVLVAVFTGRFGLFAAGVSKTGDPTKACTDPVNAGVESDGPCEPGKAIIAAKPTPGKICCR